ncbi:hypothetical protein RhiirA4_415198 [Rhizophagus irregularis]|uniref:Uncharacterized protein n=1 Tax=Rhizophagus irregularis TaxID=588596 RepID=A0A2I1FZ36_9GLOM|nr:hypothetical protein RhiirA4_415198 [Rhizophagus irregularis]
MDTLDQLTEVHERQAREKIYNPKTNRMIIINGPAYHKLLCDGYMHWREERLLIPPLYESPILRRSQVTPKEGGEEAGEVNICQVSNLIPGETVEMIAQRIMRDSLSEKEVKAIAKALTSPNPVTATSRLSRLRRELRKLNAPEKIISATYDEKTTCASNKIQKERKVQRENEGIDFPDHFSLESVKERLNLYDVSKTPTVCASPSRCNDHALHPSR